MISADEISNAINYLHNEGIIFPDESRPPNEEPQITEQDLRDTLLNSEEKATKSKTIDQLNEETINVINDLYEKILLREADPVGLIHFGNLFESGMTSDKIRVMLLESDEAKTISPIHPVRGKIMMVYGYIFDGQPDNSFVDHYHKMIDDGFVAFPDWIDNIIIWEGEIVCSGYSACEKISADEVSIAINNLLTTIILEIPLLTLVFEKNSDTKKIFFLIFGIVFIVFLFTSDGHRYTMDEDLGAQMALGMVTLEPHPDYVQGGTEQDIKKFFPKWI